MRRLFSYIKSHIYDIHAILAATFAVFLLYLIKKPIKKYLESCLDKKLQKYPEKKEKREQALAEKRKKEQRDFLNHNPSR